MKILNLKKLIVIILLSVILIAAGCSSQPGAPKTLTPVSTPTATSWSSAPAMQIATSKQYFAEITTSLGTFKIELYPKEAPKTVNNFIFLSLQKFYNGVIFHRIMKNFMVQTGDPKGTGSGSPGYKFPDELPAKHSYQPGIVAMANSGPNTNGSQFFICTGSDASLSLDSNPNYTQFGKVIEGMDIVQKIASVPVGPSTSNPREISKPLTPPVINSITITEQ